VLAVALEEAADRVAEVALSVDRHDLGARPAGTDGADHGAEEPTIPVDQSLLAEQARLADRRGERPHIAVVEQWRVPPLPEVGHGHQRRPTKAWHAPQ